eukprot:CAMPEP_0183313828 /NCGR_PEP_ID=MMETSP0160_2-20130417/46653_1 /TAXON_ID=2839 ORGANISM="Odontella Sinensis, Strain Grunow 1884" /NCGR_SAMPLE_ID=MMETSP0160_2 /ASSEMBLY_ACC=CAM_ASM_000250 /LENGTH=56 /DNA_ID=CAMNT_0025478995 /DNA_START=90 /DNA_END=260 /DNA_ORIENTATION=-
MRLATGGRCKTCRKFYVGFRGGGVGEGESDEGGSSDEDGEDGGDVCGATAAEEVVR